jgi:glycosyltransferase involved in cell wall biosynthesis
MLSICIPIYNVKVSGLVEALLAQANALNVSFEVILIDDCSSSEFANENMKWKAPSLTYLGLHENIGRAKIRNMFLNAARYNYLLFLDCDSRIVSESFVKDYIAEIEKGVKVVCGGRIYTTMPPPIELILHWVYGEKKESKPAAKRMMNPYQSFMTNNFLIEKKVLEAIPFDERLSGYGHEDTLFGYQLKKKGIPIKHIDNAVLHAQLEMNLEFVEKSENAISNLKCILDYVRNDPAFIGDVKLLKYYTNLKKYKLLFLVKFPFWLTRRLIKNRLSKGLAIMPLFDFYKLGYLASAN